MVDVNKMLAGLSQSGISAGLLGGLAGGAVTGALMSKKGRKTAGTLVKLGGVAAIGGLAWNAYQNFQRRQASNGELPDRRWQALTEDRFDVGTVTESTAGAEGLLLIRAMIAAAVSDGHIDASERQRIFDRIDQLDMSSDEKAALLDEFRNPRLIEEIVAESRDPAIATEVYAASMLAIDETTEHGRTYLENLRLLLRLPEGLVAALRERAQDAAPIIVAA